MQSLNLELKYFKLEFRIETFSERVNLYHFSYSVPVVRIEAFLSELGGKNEWILFTQEKDLAPVNLTAVHTLLP